MRGKVKNGCGDAVADLHTTRSKDATRGSWPYY